MKMSNLTKKIVAVVTTVTCAVWMMGPGVAQALTAEEIQAMIDDLLAQIAELQAQLAELEGGEVGVIEGVPADFTFENALKQGDSGIEVKYLQIVLNSDPETQLAESGVGSPGNETEYFGPLTKAAVIKFQEKYAEDVLAYWGLTSGTGFVGSTTRAKLNELLAAGVAVEEEEEEEEEEEVVGEGPATVELAADTPAAAQVALNAQDAVFTKIKFYGGAEGVTITKIVVKRGGVSADADISAIKLYDGTTQLGSTQALNTNTHKATFSGLSWEVPAGETKVLTIKANIAARGTATVGDSVKLGIESANDITATAEIEGTFPIYGNAKTIAGISVGELFVQAQTVPAAANLLSGAVEQEIASWKFTASSTEGVEVHSIRITHVGTATREDISNIKLKVAGVQIGETVEQLDSSNSATFDVEGDLNILASGSKTVYAYCDIASGIWTSRTIKFEITQYTDVVAYGANSGGAIQASYDDTTTFTAQTGREMTISQGSLTVTVDASLNPADQNYVRGTEDRLIAAFKFSPGSREGVRITELKLTLSGQVTDISNVTLWDGSTQIAGPASAIGSYVTFGSNTIGWDTTGLFDVEKGTTKTILVKADIPSGATYGNNIKLYIDSSSHVKADGLDSHYDISSSDINVDGAGSGHVSTHTIQEKGSLTVSKSSLTPASQTYVIGATGKVFAKVNLTAGSGEDVTVSSIVVDCYDAASKGSACDASSHLSNLKVLLADGTQYGSTAVTPYSSSTFSGTLTVPAGETVTLSLVADIPLSDYPNLVALQVDGADITVTGASSAGTITATDYALGSDISIGQGSLTVAAAASPGDQTIIRGATQVPLVGLVMSAGTAEDIRITKVKLTGCEEGANAEIRDDLSYIALYEGDEILTVKKGFASTATTVEFTASDFLNSLGIDLAKGGQKTITVKADLPSTATEDHAVALGIASASDVSFVGLSSNQTPDATLVYGSSLDGVNYAADGDAAVYYTTIKIKGSLTAEVAADSPETDIVAVGSDGVEATFLKVKFKALLEDIDITSIEVERAMSYDVDFDSVSLWDGSDQLGVDQDLVNGSTTFSFTAEDGGYWRIPAGTEKTLTVKAKLNGIKGPYGVGVIPGDTPKLCLAADLAGNLKVETLGVSSGVTTIKASSTAVATDLCDNWMKLHESKPTLAAASLPSTVYGAGEKTLYRWTVTAGEKGDIGWQKVVIDISGSVTVSGTSYTIGYGTSTASANNLAIYMGTSSDPGTKFADTLTFYNVATGESLTASSTYVYNDKDNGGAKVIFVPASEEVVAAGTTKTYELRAALKQAGASGDTVSAKIAAVASATSTDTFHTVAGGDDYPKDTGMSFVWTDRSGYGGGDTYTHSTASQDWTDDYKVDGIPTATLSLSK